VIPQFFVKQALIILSILSFNCVYSQEWNEQVFNAIEDQRNATCLLIFDGAYTCTGTLINNTNEDGKPLILTAAHCIDDPELINSIIAIFGRRKLLINADLDAVEWKSNIGATLTYYSKEHDMMLLELTESPPNYLNAPFMGWSAGRGKIFTPITVHHPSFGFQEIAIERGTVVPSSFNQLSTFGISTLKNGFWKISDWSVGSTKIGSSGAALLDQNFKIVGTLSGGVERSNGESFDYFSRFDLAYQSIELQESLNPKKLLAKSQDYFKSNNQFKIKNYSPNDTVALEIKLFPGDTLIEDIGHFVEGSVKGVYITLQDWQADILNNVTVVLYENHEAIYAEQSSLFSLTENSENFIPLLGTPKVNGTLQIGIKFESSDRSEYIIIPKTGKNSILTSILIESENRIPSENFGNENTSAIFPNPTSGYFVISGGHIINVEIHTAYGLPIIPKMVSTASNQMLIDLNELPKGVYFIHVEYENQHSFTEKIIFK
jgi:hypothetical protein